MSREDLWGVCVLTEIGNAHFSFMELNNLEIVPLLDGWIQTHV